MISAMLGVYEFLIIFPLYYSRKTNQCFTKDVSEGTIMSYMIHTLTLVKA